jgi:hypothetical protein
VVSVAATTSSSDGVRGSTNFGVPTDATLLRCCSASAAHAAVAGATRSDGSTGSVCQPDGRSRRRTMSLVAAPATSGATSSVASAQNMTPAERTSRPPTRS